MEYSLTLLLAGILLLVYTSHSNAKGNSRRIYRKREDTPLNSVIMDGSDITSRLGAELVQGLHIAKLQCQMNISLADMKHQKKIAKMINYYEDFEKITNNPDFPKEGVEIRKGIETNSHNSIKRVELNRKYDLRSIARSCEVEQKEWISDQFLSLLTHAASLLSQNSTAYIELLLKMSYYKEKITTEMKTCVNGSTPEYLSLDCYIDEMKMVVDSVSDFLQSMEDMYSDDEDRDREDSSSSSSEREEKEGGSGSGEVSDSEDGPPVASPSLPSGEEDTNNERPEVTPPTEIQQDTSTTQTQQEMVTNTNVPWVDEAFEDVARIRENGKAKIPSQQQGSKVKTKAAKTSDVEIHGSLDGNEVVIDVELLGHHDGVPLLNPSNLIFDGDDDDDNDKHKDKNIRWTAIHYVILSFSLTLGIVIIILIITVVSIATYKRCGEREAKPNSSDKEMLNVMKKTGYVNPTYKYYTKT